uniref:Uncharacterized protein n=1 Tax=Romanomermis culicivorax TaxID=13658 RepID=A0A915IWV0_ROMCU
MTIVQTSKGYRLSYEDPRVSIQKANELIMFTKYLHAGDEQLIVSIPVLWLAVVALMSLVFVIILPSAVLWFSLRSSLKMLYEFLTLIIRLHSEIKTIHGFVGIDFHNSLSVFKTQNVPPVAGRRGLIELTNECPQKLFESGNEENYPPAQVDHAVAIRRRERRNPINNNDPAAGAVGATVPSAEQPIGVADSERPYPATGRRRGTSLFKKTSDSFRQVLSFALGGSRSRQAAGAAVNPRPKSSRSPFTGVDVSPPAKSTPSSPLSKEAFIGAE